MEQFLSKTWLKTAQSCNFFMKLFWVVFDVLVKQLLCLVLFYFSLIFQMKLKK